MQHKFPFTALHFTVPTEEIDVNVHPTKLEVRFTNGEALYQFVYRTVQEALSEKNMIPDILLSEEKRVRTVYAPTPESFEHRRITYSKEAVRDEAERVREEAIKATLASPLFSQVGKDAAQDTAGAGVPETQQEVPVSGNSLREEVVYGGQPTEKPGQISLFDKSEQNKEAFLKQEQEDHHQIIGQLFATYWLDNGSSMRAVERIFKLQKLMDQCPGFCHREFCIPFDRRLARQTGNFFQNNIRCPGRRLRYQIVQHLKEQRLPIHPVKVFRDCTDRVFPPPK